MKPKKKNQTTKINQVIENQAEEKNQNEPEKFTNEFSKKLTENENQIAELNSKVNDLTEAKLNLLADFKNYRRRTEENIFTYKKLAIKELLFEIIEIVDDKNRAKENTKTDKELLEGYETVFSKLDQMLLHQGLTVLEVKEGDKFNPEYMEAISVINLKNTKMSGKVISVLSKGYKLTENNQVFKTAQVVIGK